VTSILEGWPRTQGPTPPPTPALEPPNHSRLPRANLATRLTIVGGYECYINSHGRSRALRHLARCPAGESSRLQPPVLDTGGLTDRRLPAVPMREGEEAQVRIDLRRK